MKAPSSSLSPPPHSSSSSATAKSRLKSLMFNFLRGGNGPSVPPAATTLFPKTDPDKDGEECLRDCESCTLRYPRSFKIDEQDVLYGHVKAWATHLLVATAKGDWVRDVEDEKGSVMEAIDKADKPKNGAMKLSASDMPTPDDTPSYDQPTTALLLPSFTLISNVQPSNVPLLISSVINPAPTTTSPLQPIAIPPTISDPSMPPLSTRPCPHSAVILMCSQRTRDARCGQSAPLLRKELERHLRPLGLYRDLHDERPGGVGVYFISHVGGHKYSANVLVYRRPNAFGLDDDDKTAAAQATNGVEETQVEKSGSGSGEDADGDAEAKTETGENGHAAAAADVGAAQCIWLARVMPEDCENLVRYTVLRGKVVKPERQLRGGFDRGRGVMSW